MDFWVQLLSMLRADKCWLQPKGGSLHRSQSIPKGLWLSSFPWSIWTSYEKLCIKLSGGQNSIFACFPFWGNQRERCETTDICFSHHILPRGHYRTRLPTWKNDIQCPPSAEQSCYRQDSNLRTFSIKGMKIRQFNFNLILCATLYWIQCA